MKKQATAPVAVKTEEIENRTEDSEVESPREFYQEFTRRSDVREILSRLAKWEPLVEPSEEHGNR